MSDETVIPEPEDNAAAEAPKPEDETVLTDLSDEAEAPGEEPEAPAEPTLEEQLAAAQAEIADLKDKFLRTVAETENVRKRAEKQVADARLYAIEKFATDLLDVSDNLGRAIAALTDEARANLSEEGKSLLDGVEMTEKTLHAAFARHGVVAVDAAPGAAFDPNVHQAVSQIPSEHPSGTVAAPFQNGWKIGERTLRAAMVAVSTGPAAGQAD